MKNKIKSEVWFNPKNFELAIIYSLSTVEYFETKSRSGFLNFNGRISGWQYVCDL